MSGVKLIAVATDETDLRLDRWFRRRYPDLGYGRLAKWLRTGQVRVDGKRAKPGTRLAPGQVVRVPPLADDMAGSAPPAPPVAVSEADVAALHAAVLYRDGDLIALNKPAGLAVQGGSKTRRHLDRMLDALSFGGERPRLVHRLDKDTSGVLLLARNRPAAARLTRAFAGRKAVKIYWALVAGVPKPRRGRLDLPLVKGPSRTGERVRADVSSGRAAVTDYAVIDTAGRRAAWLALRPETGRTHQLRVHCATMGTPIVGDGKYGGKRAFIAGISGKLHLHARAIALPHPASGEILRVEAPLVGHMAESWAFLGLDPDSAREPFDDG